MEAGPPGPPGLPAAPPVGLASRCASGPAATPRPGTGAGCAWDRTGRKGTYRSAQHHRPPTFCHSSAVGSLWFYFWIQLSLSVATLSVELNCPLFLTSLNFDQSLVLTAFLGCCGPCEVLLTEQFPTDWSSRDSGHPALSVLGFQGSSASEFAGESLCLLESSCPSLKTYSSV